MPRLFVLCMVSAQAICQAPNWNWAIKPDSMYCYTTVADNSGNLYVGGGYRHYLNKYDSFLLVYKSNTSKLSMQWIIKK